MRINPHPSGDPRYDVEVVGPAEYEGMVTVRYIDSPQTRWDVNEDAVEEWTVEEPRCR